MLPIFFLSRRKSLRAKQASTASHCCLLESCGAVVMRKRCPAFLKVSMLPVPWCRACGSHFAQFVFTAETLQS